MPWAGQLAGATVPGKDWRRVQTKESLTEAGSEWATATPRGYLTGQGSEVGSATAKEFQKEDTMPLLKAAKRVYEKAA